MNRAQLLACPECDLLQHDVPSPRPCKALCARCGAVLYQRGDGGLERTLALTVTALVLPLAELAALAYLLVPLRNGIRSPGFAEVFRLVQFASRWGAVEVFVLGALVSLVKLGHLADVEPGVALASYGALMLVMASIEASFDPRELWARLTPA